MKAHKPPDDPSQTMIAPRKPDDAAQSVSPMRTRPVIGKTLQESFAELIEEVDALQLKVQELTDERDEWKREAERSKWPQEAAQEYHQLQAEVPALRLRVQELEQVLRKLRVASAAILELLGGHHTR